jgi:transketolase
VRETLSSLLVEHVQKNSKAYVLSGDHGYALFDELRKNKPNHFLNAGVAEQNMIGVGAGLSKVGLFPIMYGLAAFLPIRVLEQIKIDFCYENLPGIFIGDGAGVVYSHLGTSHQSTEDIAALRAIPKMTILSPCDAYELKACFHWAVLQKSPVYLRLGKADLGQVHKKDILIGNSEPIPVLNSGHGFAVFATGSMVKPCYDLIEKNNLPVDLYSVPVLKSQQISQYSILANYKKVMTVEEHSVFGGLGDLVSGLASEFSYGPVKKIGIKDQFSNLCGTYQYLMSEHGLDPKSILSQMQKWFLL